MQRNTVPRFYVSSGTCRSVRSLSYSDAKKKGKNKRRKKSRRAIPSPACRPIRRAVAATSTVSADKSSCGRALHDITRDVHQCERGERGWEREREREREKQSRVVSPPFSRSCALKSCGPENARRRFDLAAAVAAFIPA